MSLMTFYAKIIAIIVIKTLTARLKQIARAAAIAVKAEKNNPTNLKD